MAFCENCIHFEVCEIDYDMMSEEVLTFFPHNEDCKLFKSTADVVEVKHGKWYRHNKKEHGDTCYYCSVCERMALSDCMVWELTKFCPHCGADMRGEK